MDCSKVGMLIRRLRMEKKLTQAALAARLNLSAKTISKWERGLGCPDVTLLNALSAVLDVDLSRLLEGDLLPNETVGGNMKNTKYYVCPDCGSISLCTGNAEISCCGRRLAALELTKAAPGEKLHVEIVEDEWFITSNHPMQKDNYISFVAFQTGGKVELIKQYPEWNLQLRLKKRGHGQLIWYSTAQGLRYQLL